jgi:hypothetical protein
MTMLSRSNNDDDNNNNSYSPTRASMGFEIQSKKTKCKTSQARADISSQQSKNMLTFKRYENNKGRAPRRALRIAFSH